MIRLQKNSEEQVREQASLTRRSKQTIGTVGNRVRKITKPSPTQMHVCLLACPHPDREGTFRSVRSLKQDHRHLDCGSLGQRSGSTAAPKGVKRRAEAPCGVKIQLSPAKSLGGSIPKGHTPEAGVQPTPASVRATVKARTPMEG